MHNNNKLYELRTKRHLTQKEFAEKVGMNAGVYSRYERGENDIPLSVATKIASAFDISIDYIAGYSQNEQGIGYDKDNDYIRTNFYNPILEKSNNKEEANAIAIQQIQKAIAELSQSVDSILNQNNPDKQ